MPYCGDALCDDPDCVSDEEGGEYLVPEVLGYVPEERTQIVLAEAEHGEDVIRKVSGWTRYLMVDNIQGALSGPTLDAGGKPRWGSALREIYSYVYDSQADVPLEKIDESSPDWIRQFVREATAADGSDKIRSQVSGDEYMAAFATREIVNATIEVAKECAPETDVKQARERVESLRELAEEFGSSDRLEAEIELAEAALAVAESNELAACVAIAARSNEMKEAINTAIALLEKSMDDLAGIMRGMGFAVGWGSHRGSGMKINTPPDELLERVRGHDELKKIAEMAGRLREESKNRRETKWKAARGEVSATTLGDDIARLLPSELMYAADEDAEWLLLRKLTEKSAQQYDVIGRERAKQGPIVLCIDESGSMECEDRILWAKAVALALMEYASSQRRQFGVVEFSKQPNAKTRFDPSRGVSAEDMLSVLERFDGGGTNIGLAIDAAVQMIEGDSALDRADIVLISDGADYQDRKAAFARMKAANIELHSIFIGGEKAPPDIVAASDLTLYMNDQQMNDDAGASAIGAIFEIGQVVDDVGE
jgi:uncharacterized protein with von Willebrand factor type A (vWA) domain